MASGISVDQDGHSYVDIQTYEDNARKVIFTPFPEAEPFDAAEIRNIYSAQLKALTAA